MEFNIQTKVADIVHRNYMLLPVLNRFDIQLGFSDVTVEELCNTKGINTDFFLVILNSFHNHDYFPQEQLLSFPINLIIDYTRKSHSYYLDLKIPYIDKLIRQLIANSGESHKKHMPVIENFFAHYKTELIEHIQEEENNIYPYIITIDKALKTGNIDESHIKLIQDNPIKEYAEEHNNVEDKLYDLKNIIIKYLPPINDNTLTNSLLIELFRLERDLNDHARIEDKVMIPKVQQIENEILERVS